MDFWTKLHAALDKILVVLDKGCKIVEVAAPIAQVIAPFTGSAAGAVSAAAGATNTIAVGVDKAITEHEAAGSTAQSGANALASIAQTVAASGAVNQDVAAKINAIATVVPAITGTVTIQN